MAERQRFGKCNLFAFIMAITAPVLVYTLIK